MEKGVVMKEMAERGKKLVKDTRQWQENVIDSEFSQSEAGFLKKTSSRFFYHFVVKADVEFFIMLERNFDETLPCSINDYI